MELILNFIYKTGNVLLPFLLKQTVYTVILFTLIYALSILLKNRSPYWRFCLWILILARLIIPADLRLPLNTHAFVKEIPVMENIGEPEGYGYYSGTGANFYKYPVVMLSSCWSIGFLFMLGILIKKSRRFNRIIKNSEAVHDSRLKDFISGWKCRLNISRKINIVCSDEFLSPFTTGLIKPVIYIPRAFLDSGGFRRCSFRYCA